MTPGYVDVVLPVGVRKSFTYSVPGNLADTVSEGARVLVPFGRKLLTGFVVGFSSGQPHGDFRVLSLRDVLDSRPLIPLTMVKTALWIADYYFTPPGDVFRALLPGGTDVEGGQRVSLNPHTERLLTGGLRPTGTRPQEDLLIDILLREGPMTSQQLSRRSKLKDTAKWIESLASAKWIRIEMFVEKPGVGIKQQLGIRALPAPQEIISALTPLQRELYSRLSPDAPAVPLQRFLKEAKGTATVAKALAQKGVVALAAMPIERTPVDLERAAARENHLLTEDQRRILAGLRELVQRPEAARCLLHGVTGSGKTEIYLRLISEVVARGESALLLVPEIGLTPLLSRLVVSRFPDQVSLLHSGMSQGERFDQWNRIREGGARVVVGTRSAVFAPLEKLRLIIIDEEQDASYKQDESPCYHAREVAWERMKQSGGVLLMGSATPSLETYYAAKETGETIYFCLTKRIEARPLPEVTLVDMGLEFQRHGKKAVISEALRLELEEQIRRGEQSIILLNRRGYARTLLCRSCGHVSTCPDCSISMTYHQNEARLICHYCGCEKQPPSACSNCGGEYIYFIGVGTEQLEEIVRTLLPAARVARVDRDTTRKRGAMRKMLFDFAEHKLDILIGTQMLAKGHDFPNVTLVGVVSADASLSFPDFRSAERTFQLLIQVAGRSGRGSIPGRVVIQAFYPDHYALRFAQRQDYDAFFRHEIELRKLMGYPPFRGLVQIVVSDDDLGKASQLAEKVASALKLHNQRIEAQSRMHILGPAVAPLEKLRGQYRFQILIKTASGAAAGKLLRDSFEYLIQHKVALKKVHVDVDPLSLL